MPSRRKEQLEKPGGLRPAGARGEELAHAAHQYIREHFSSPEGCSTGQIAEHLGVTEPHLCRCYRAAFERTIGADTRQLRIALACRLLADPSLSVMQVRNECGYAGLSYRMFLTAFKAEAGMSPSQYRRTGVPHRRDGNATRKIV